MSALDSVTSTVSERINSKIIIGKVVFGFVNDCLTFNGSFADGACIMTRIKPCFDALAVKFVTALAHRSHPLLGAIEHLNVVVFIWSGKRDWILQHIQRLEANTTHLA